MHDNMDYPPGSRFLLALEDHPHLIVEVVRPLTPFTMSQLFVVKCASDTPQYPTCMVLKIYDPRFLPHRTAIKIPRPWTHAAETVAASRRKSRRDVDFNPTVRAKQEDGLAGWEEYYFQLAEKQYHSELTAYTALATLQGVGIPRCYGGGQVALAGRTIAPSVLLLEYIHDACTLRDADPAVVPLHLLRTLTLTVRSLGSLGIIHNDINPGNILFTPADNPTRVFLIDFGESYTRCEESDEQWKEELTTSGELRWTKSCLARILKIDPSGGFFHRDTQSQADALFRPRCCILAADVVAHCPRVLPYPSIACRSQNKIYGLNNCNRWL